MVPLRHVLWVAVLLALPAAHAGEVTHYVAEALEADGGAAAAGPLAAISFYGTEARSPTLLVNAEDLRVENDVRYEDHYSPALALAKQTTGVDGPTWHTEYGNFTDASAYLLAARDGYRVFIAPPGQAGRADLEVSAPFIGLSVDGRGPVEEPPGAGNPDRAPAEAPVAGSFEAATRGGTMLLVSGDFLVVLWEADLQVRDERQQVDYTSGHDVRQAAQVPPPFTPVNVYGESYARETYLYVTNGTLELTVPDATWEALDLHATAAAASGSITFREALQQDVGLPGSDQPSDTRLAGPVACTLAPFSDRIEAWIVPEAAAQESDPKDGALGLLSAAGADGGAGPATRAAAWEAVPAWAAPSLLAVALLAGGLLAVRALMHTRAMGAVRNHMEDGDYEAAVEEVEGPLRSRRHRREASVIGIVAALQLADVARARDLLRRSRKSLAKDPALEPYLGACIAAASQDVAKARALLRDSLRLDGTLAEHARSNPFLSRVLRPDDLEPGYT